MRHEVAYISVAASPSLWVASHFGEMRERFFEEGDHFLIVPELEVDIFTKLCPGTVVLSERAFIEESASKQLKENLEACGNGDRYGWYLQQFLKLSALDKFRPHYNKLVIWDADGLPLREIRFYDEIGNPVHYFGDERHLPYFGLIERLSPQTRFQSKSFIAQCFPTTKELLELFFSKFGGTAKSLIERLLKEIDFAQISGFSEYELLGSVMYSGRSPNWQTGNRWSRYGNSWIYPHEMSTKRAHFLSRFYDFVSFESWSVTRIERLRDACGWLPSIARRRIRSLSRKFSPNHLRKFLAKFRNQGSSEKSTAQSFLEDAFAENATVNVRNIVQIGANDGLQNDPLRQLIAGREDLAVTLVEPVPFYFDSLQRLYKDQPNVRLVQAAAGEANGNLDIYHIHPVIAELMNDRVNNGWAHGQGSSSLTTVQNEIVANSWRGVSFRRQLRLFLSSISVVNVPIKKTSDIFEGVRPDLLLVDVQGYEPNVLRGLSGDLPKYLYIETQLEDPELLAVAENLGYRQIIQGHDSVFELRTENE